MPKAAIFFCVLLFSPIISNSYAFLPDLTNESEINFTNSDIIKIDPDFFTENNLKRYLIFGNNLQNNDLTELNPISTIQSENGFFSVSILTESKANNLIKLGYHVIEDFKLDFHNATNINPLNNTIDASRIGDITGANTAKSKYNSTGDGVTIAIIDTGVDFSNPDIQHSLARDKLNHPIMLDPDGQGIVLTNATFFAHIDENEIIQNYSKPTPENMTSVAYVSRDGVFLDVSQGGKGSDIPVYNSFFPQAGDAITFNGSLTTDVKIGEDNRNFIKSKSGVYHLGIIYQGALSGALTRIQVVPVLLVDSYTPGVYDTIIPDLSTSWKDYTRYDLEKEPEYDFDFTDELPIVLGSGNEFLTYDSNDDGKNDYSAGTVGAKVLDIYGVFGNSTNIDDTLKATNGTLLPSIDPNGNFFGIMTDFMGHGTASAASITSRGQVTYDIYNNSKSYSITGVAPDAKIIPVKALWFGDTVYGWLWSAGFENNGTAWEYSGKPKVDIISNSWGVSAFPTFNAAPGFDILSLILSVLATPHSIHNDYPGITIISSAGNSGHGYGTIGLPNASPFGITVGATTNNVFVGYGPFKDEPRFGNTTTHYNDVVDFSSRGPSVLGDPKPDLMSIGAHGFVPSSVIKLDRDSKVESFSLFGGTSMAAPLVSGSAAILIEELKKQSKDYDSFLIKNILMSTATDLYNDPFTQGAGLVNVESALDFVNGNNGVFIIHNDQSYQNIKEILEPAIKKINSTSIGFEEFKLPSNKTPMTGWFAGQILAGDRSSTTFTIENPTNDTITIHLKPQTLALIEKTQFNGTTIPKQLDLNSNKTDVYAPNYIKLAEFGNQSKLGTFFNNEYPIPEESLLMVLNLNFLFDDFMNSTTPLYADDIKISSLYLYDWIDGNNDTKVTSNELSMVNRGGTWGTVQELRVSEPNEKFDGVPLVGVYPVPARYSYWLGETKLNSTAMDYTISASYYEKERWPIIWSDSESITVQPKSFSTVDVTLIPPIDSQTGIYQGFLSFEGEQHTVNAPVSFVIKEPIINNDSDIIIKGTDSDDVLYGNGFTKGAFDMVNRYMAGDWRQYYFDIQNESINTAAIELSWISNNTNLSVFVMNPLGEIIHTNVPAGVFGHFMEWVSLDWLGNSVFSQGGGFYPIKNKDDTSTVLYIPINQTGTYTILAHTTLFGGESTTEPITLAAKFTNISPEMTSLDMLDSAIDYTIDSTNTTTSSNTTNQTEPTIQSNPVTPIVTTIQTTNPYSEGIIIGIAIGVAISLVFILIMRQKT